MIQDVGCLTCGQLIGQHRRNRATERPWYKPVADLVTVTEGTPIPAHVAVLTKSARGARENPTTHLLGLNADHCSDAGTSVQQHLHEPISQRNTAFSVLRLALIDRPARELAANHVALHPCDLFVEVDGLPPDSQGFAGASARASEVAHDVRQVMTPRDLVAVGLLKDLDRFLDRQRARTLPTLAVLNGPSFSHWIDGQRAMSHSKTADTGHHGTTRASSTGGILTVDVLDDLVDSASGQFHDREPDNTRLDKSAPAMLIGVVTRTAALAGVHHLPELAQPLLSDVDDLRLSREFTHADLPVPETFTKLVACLAGSVSPGADLAYLAVKVPELAGRHPARTVPLRLDLAVGTNRQRRTSHVSLRQAA